MIESVDLQTDERGQELLVVGLIAQTRRRTVCGMLTGAGLDRDWTGRGITAARTDYSPTPAGRVTRSDWL